MKVTVLSNADEFFRVDEDEVVPAADPDYREAGLTSGPAKAGDFYRVNQDEVAISSGLALDTTALFTCSGIAVSQNGKTLLAHVDALCKTGDLADAIRDNFDLAGDDLHITVIPGAEDCESSLNKIGMALATLDLTDKATLHTQYDDYFKHLVVTPDGSVSSQWRYHFEDMVQKKDGVRYVFLTNARDVRSLPNGDLEAIKEDAPDEKKIYHDCIVGKAWGEKPGVVGLFMKEALPPLRTALPEPEDDDERLYRHTTAPGIMKPA